MRSAIRLLLEQKTAFQGVGEAETAAALWEQLADSRPDLVLLDWELPGLPAVGSVATLHAGYPALILIALSSRLEARQAALRAGADGFVSKSEPPFRRLAIVKQYQSHANCDFSECQSDGGKPVDMKNPKIKVKIRGCLKSSVWARSNGHTSGTMIIKRS